MDHRLTIILCCLLLLLAPLTTFAQKASDQCEVYIVDEQKAKKSLESTLEKLERMENPSQEETDALAKSAGVTVAGRFSTKVGEEELTTKHYPFPGSNLTITASIYYTDEMMASADHSDSILIGIVVSENRYENALSVANNAVAEVSYNEATDKIRVKKNIRVNGRSYLVGVECSCRDNTRSK